MESLSIQIALDFIECTAEQKLKFIQYLESLNWQPINPNKLWAISTFNQGIETIQQIESELILAKKISQLYELDYEVV